MKVYQVQGDRRYDYYNKSGYFDTFYDTIIFSKIEDAKKRLEEIKLLQSNNYTDFPLLIEELDFK